MTKENKSMIDIITQSDTDENKGKELLDTSTIEIINDNQLIFGYLGDALNDDNINDFINDVRPHLIVLVGFPEYGKSTFVSSLYHILLTDGKIGDNKFIDSDTILGFERRIFVRRHEKNFKRRLNRTTLLENYFLTLDFINKNNERKKLVISDRSGEAYEQYCGNVTSIREDRAIKYTNHIIFFLDASKLLASNILTEISLIRQLTNRFNNEGILKPNMTLDIIFNKIDTITEKNERYNNNKIRIINTIETEGKIKINRIFEINSSITEGNLELHELFTYLVDSYDLFDKIENKEEGEELDWIKSKVNLM